MNSSKYNPNTCRFVLFGVASLLLAVFEVTLLTLEFDTSSSAFQNMPYPLYGSLLYSSKALRIIIASLGALVILSLPHIKLIQINIQKQQKNPYYLRFLFLHFLTLAGFYYLCWLLIVAIPGGTITTNLMVNVYGIGWLFLGLLSITCLLLFIADIEFWLELVKKEAKIFLAAALTGLISQTIGFFTTTFWEKLPKWSFLLTKDLLGLLYPNVIDETENLILGVNDFSVEISPQCSGYEGMGLITVFLTLYLWMFRKQLRFPHVLIMLPIGVIAIWLLNIVRITLLIIIGDKISSKIATGGFHSSAGWIIFVGLSVGLIVVLQKISFFNKAPGTTSLAVQTDNTDNKALALLIPFAVLLTSILLSNVFSHAFDWFYPLKVVISIMVLWYYRKIYCTYKRELNPVAVLIGVVVFFVWLALVPNTEEANVSFAKSLFSESPTIVTAWLSFRVLGACVTVPIIEELVFRGYILSKLINKDITQVREGTFTWLSFIVSSVLFGLLHGNWLAGTMAGMAFAYALYRRGHLFDAVIAHSVTNLLLSFYVIYTQNWSLW